MFGFNLQIGSAKLQLKPMQAPRTPWTTQAMTHIDKAAKSDRGFLVRHVQAGFWGVMAAVPMSGDGIVSAFEAVGKAFEGIGRFIERDDSKGKKQFQACMDKVAQAVKYVAMAVVSAALSLFVPDKVVQWNYNLGLARAPHPMSVVQQASHALGLNSDVNIKV